MVQLKVPAQVYEVSEEEIEFVTLELRSLLERRGFLTMGAFCEQFEEAFAQRHQTRFASCLSSGTAALEAILSALDVAGGEVVVPSNTFAATAFAVVRAGARPVFADISSDLCADPADVARRIGPDTRAVVTVHVGGLVSPSTEELVRLCDQHGVPLVEDAAHAHGSALHGRSAGSFGIAGAFSFFSTKVMTTGEGGMVTTDDERIHERVRLLRDQAKVDGKNLHEVVGASWRMTEVQAMLGIGQLRRLDAMIAARRRVAERYDSALDGIPGLHPLGVPAGVDHNFYKYVVVVDEGIDPGRLQAELKAAHQVALGGTVYDVPLHEQPVFAASRSGRLRVAEDLCRRHICPPIYPSLTDAQVDHVASSLASVLGVERQEVA